MPAPVSMDLRRRLVEAVAQGSSIRAAARRFAVSPSAAIKLMQRVEATGSPAPDRYGGQRRPILEPHRTALERMVAAEPRATLAELRERLRQRHGVSVRLSTLHALCGGSKLGRHRRRLGGRLRQVDGLGRSSNAAPVHQAVSPVHQAVSSAASRQAVKASARLARPNVSSLPMPPSPIRSRPAVT